MKSHFTNRKYDFFRYGGKSRATMSSFNKRKDKYWFEKTSRKYSDEQIVDFLLANFVTTDNPKNLWIGEIINSGERTYACLLYTSPSPRDCDRSRMPSSA